MSIFVDVQMSVARMVYSSQGHNTYTCITVDSSNIICLAEKMRVIAYKNFDI